MLAKNPSPRRGSPSQRRGEETIDGVAVARDRGEDHIIGSEVLLRKPEDRETTALGESAPPFEGRPAHLPEREEKKRRLDQTAPLSRKDLRPGARIVELLGSLITPLLGSQEELPRAKVGRDLCHIPTTLGGKLGSQKEW